MYSCIQGNISPCSNFAPFVLNVRVEFKDWANSNVSIFFSFNTTVSWRIQDRKNCLEKQNGKKKNAWGKNNSVYSSLDPILNLLPCTAGVVLSPSICGLWGMNLHSGTWQQGLFGSCVSLQQGCGTQSKVRHLKYTCT